MVYSEEDEIDGFYFMTKGLCSFILPKMTGMIFCVIDPEQTMNKATKRRMRTFQYVGIEDTIQNHLKLLNDEKKSKQ